MKRVFFRTFTEVFQKYKTEGLSSVFLHPPSSVFSSSLSLNCDFSSRLSRAARTSRVSLTSFMSRRIFLFFLPAGFPNPLVRVAPVLVQVLLGHGRRPAFGHPLSAAFSSLLLAPSDLSQRANPVVPVDAGFFFFVGQVVEAFLPIYFSDDLFIEFIGLTPSFC